MSKLSDKFDKLIGTTQSVLDSMIDCIPLKPKDTFDAGFMPISKVTSRNGDGFNLTGNACADRKTSYTNFLLVAQTGSYKSSACVQGSIMSLARGRSSMFINDPSGGENWDKCAPRLASIGYLLWLIDPSCPECSESINLVEACMGSFSQIQKLSHLITENGSEGAKATDPFWAISQEMMISNFIRIASELQPQYRNMRNVLHLIDTFAVSEKVHELVLKINKQEITDSYRTMLALSEKTLSSIIASARANLKIFYDEGACRITSSTSIDLNDIRYGKKPVAIFLRTPLVQLDYYKVVSALFISQIFNHLLSAKPGDPAARDTFFLLDECATYTFPGFSNIVSNCRKWNMGICIVLQHKNSLRARYPVAECDQILGNCGIKVFLKGTNSLETATELSALMGKRTFVVDKATGQQMVRSLMSPDEIRQCEDALIFIANHPPIRSAIHPLFKNPYYAKLMNMPPLVLPTKNTALPPLYPFD
jgi:type IV secretion system protein VirD4